MRYRGYYSDGFTAQRHEVTVQPVRNALHLYRETGETLDEWPYRGLFLSEEVHAAGPVRLRHRRRGEAMLAVEDARVLGRIAELGGPRLGGGFWSRPSLKVGLAAVLVLAGVVLGAYWLTPHLLAPLARWVPPEWETALGRQVVASLAGEQASCRGQAGAAALERLSARLTEAMRAQLGADGELPYPIHVQVLPGEAVNAFAAPGGQVVLLAGLLDFAEKPEEVAGVLAHELAHVAKRHPMQGLIRVAGISLLLNTLLGDTSTLESAAGQFTRWLVLTSYTRHDELNADRTAVRLLNATDIDARGLSGFLARVEARQAAQGGKVPSLLSTHPLFDDRIALVQAEATGTGAALTPRQWKALQTICEE